MAQSAHITNPRLDPSRLLQDLPARIGDAIAPWVAHMPDRPAVIDNGGSWTYAELGGAQAAARRWLEQREIRAGDRVVLVAENCRTAVALLLALSVLDAWAVPVTPRLSAVEIEAIRSCSGARCVLHAIGTAPALQLHASRHGAEIATIPVIGPIGIGSFDAAAEPEPLDPDPARRVAAVIYTSGSTGRPKGVMLTNRNGLFVAAASGLIRSIGPEDRLACILPMSHSVGLSALLLCAMLHGASLRLFPRFNPAELLTALEREPLSILLGAPGLFALLLDYAGRKGLATIGTRALRIISCSGAPLDPAVKAAAERLFGMPLGHGYGVTEAGPTIAQTPPGIQRDDLSVGPPLPGVQTRLLAADGTAVTEDGGTGELWVRGPNIMAGYYRAPAETAAVVDAQGWLNTGDLASIRDGNLFLLGRTKELIIRFGFNVYPSEVEAVLNAHPAVVQSAVIGRAAGSEEQIVAFVQPTPGAAPSQDELARHAAARLASYKLPSEIVFVTSMPMAPNGKILKRQLLLPAAPAEGAVSTLGA